ncbi:hypothetical protein T484DRAFT_1929193 [Baffinella frigidus]|nr:hypothetical protein T484DRAFT_1929193 [Cryptophyta sp. CCMP2293]
MLGGGGMMGAFPLGGLGGGGAMTYESMLDLDKSVKKPGLSAAELRALGKVVVSEEQACGEDACTICLEAFRAGGRATQLVCKHLFHSDCIERWLADHAVCPLCRCQVGDGKG